VNNVKTLKDIKNPFGYGGSVTEQEVQGLLAKGVIQPVVDREAPGFHSKLFLVPTKGDQYRSVINLNKWILFYYHFKIEGIHVVRGLLTRKDFMTRIDLKFYDSTGRTGITTSFPYPLFWFGCSLRL